VEALRSLITGFCGLNPEFAMFAVVLKLASGGGSKLQEKREKTMDGLKELFNSKMRMRRERRPWRKPKRLNDRKE